MIPKNIFGVFAWVTDRGVTTTKVTPMEMIEGDDPHWKSVVHEGIVRSLGISWDKTYETVSFASESKEEVDLFYLGLESGAKLFSGWMSIYKKQQQEEQMEWQEILELQKQQEEMDRQKGDCGCG